MSLAEKLTCSPQREVELLCPHFLWLLSLAMSCTLTLGNCGTESSLFLLNAPYSNMVIYSQEVNAAC